MRSPFALLLLVALLADGPAEARKWTDNTGGYSVEARFVEIREGTVYLQKGDGSTVGVPVSRLCEADHRYLRSLGKLESAAPSPAAKPGPGGAGEQAGPGAAPAPAGGRKRPRTKVDPVAVEKALARPTTYAFKDRPLHGVVEELASQHQIESWLDRAGLQQAGVAADVAITASGKGERLQTAFENIFASRDLKLECLARDDVLYVTTVQKAAALFDTRVYAFARTIHPDTIVDHILLKVAPESWDRVGGLASIAGWEGGAVAITHAQRIHQQIEKQYASSLRRITPVEARPAAGDVAPAARLAQPVECDYAGTPLRDVAQEFSSRYGVRIAIDPKALQTAGIAADTPITGRLRGVRLGSALDLLAESVGLSWAPEENGVRITTPALRDAAVYPVTYDLRGLVPARSDAGTLAEVVTRVIRPASWTEAKGRCTVKVLANRTSLEVRQTWRGHQQVAELLAALALAAQR